MTLISADWGLLKYLKQRKPRDAFGIVGITLMSLGISSLDKLLRQKQHNFSTPEIGQIFGLRRCPWLQGVMQGSSHLEESDRCPLDRCPTCLCKLQAAIGSDVTEKRRT
ncbi:archaemetzincin-2 [Phoenicopterus ruber ruber]